MALKYVSDGCLWCTWQSRWYTWRKIKNYFSGPSLTKNVCAGGDGAECGGSAHSAFCTTIRSMHPFLWFFPHTIKTLGSKCSVAHLYPVGGIVVWLLCPLDCELCATRFIRFLSFPLLRAPTWQRTHITPTSTIGIELADHNG